MTIQLGDLNKLHFTMMIFKGTSSTSSCRCYYLLLHSFILNNFNRYPLLSKNFECPSKQILKIKTEHTVPRQAGCS